MKSLTISRAVAVVLALLAAVSCSKSDAVKVGVVDYAKVFKEIEHQKTVSDDVKAKQDSVNSRIYELDREIRRLTSERDKLPETAPQAERESLESSIGAKESELAVEKLAFERLAGAAEQSALDGIDQKIRFAVGDVARTQGYTLVLDIDGKSIQGARYQSDPLQLTSLTKEVIDRLGGAQ